MEPLAEYVDGLPNLCGQEPLISEAITAGRKYPVFPHDGDIERAASTFAVALHMHQPLIPAGGDLRSAPVISNLAWMMDHQDIGDNHNAPVFVWCYKRMGEFIRQLLGEGRQPRVMLDYSGTLLHGMRQMGLDDVFDALGYLTRDPRARQAVEWLGCTWGHAVAPSTPPQDFRLHVRAWQHHFAAIFGLEALGRVRGFSPAEMALPNHPDVACAFVRTLADCGYQWVLVQEHTVEQPDGRGVRAPASAAPAGVHRLARQHRQHRRGDQDPGQRHQAGGPDAALLRGQKPASRGAGGPADRPCWSRRSPMARTAAS